MKPADLALLRLPGAPTLSPDGTRAVLAVTRADLDADDYRSQLWLVDTTGATPPRRLTEGPKDSSPVWSPDGRWIAFLRAGEEGKPQLHLLPAELGDARPVTTDEHHPLGAGAPRWSPDSTRLAYSARVPEQGRYGTDKDRGPEKEPPRRITRLRAKEDGIGWLLDRQPHVFVLDPFADEPAPVQVTDGECEDTHVGWAPDGGLLFSSDRDTPVDTNLHWDVYGCAADGSGLRKLTRGGQDAGCPVASADGGTVYFLATTDLGPTGSDFIGRHGAVWSVPADGSAAPTRLTGPETDLQPSGGGDQLLRDGDSLLALTRNRGAQELVRVPLAGGEPEVVFGGAVTGTAAAIAGGTIVVTAAEATSAGELHKVGRDEPLTAFGAELTAAANLRPLRELTTTAPDDYPVHGWLVHPDPERYPGRRPVLLAIHGGPHAQYGYTLFDEAQVYADAGYLVVLGNPRGAAGYGEDHARAIRHRMGTVDADDLLALLDAALTDEAADPSKVGVMGGSYGGFMTSWLIGHVGERFRAAIVERAVTAWDSFLGSSDIGFTFAPEYVGTDPAAIAEQSPLTYADKIDMPVLIIHSEHDWRCPVEQGQRLYVALRMRGVPAELLLFPGEGHELSRSGLPSHRLARFDAVLDWWSRYLS
ncbi:MAG TPA: S9 family peptidase [Mycobacteriales bacterium]|nr:S9 family peptidase [Mycobacteriales bacterium]